MNPLNDQPRRGRTVAIIIAAVVSVLVIAGAIIAAVSTGGGNGTGDEQAGPPATSTQGPPSADPGTGSGESGATGFGTPTADYTGRAMLTPNNPAGQPRGELRSAVTDVCGAGERDNPADDVAIENTAPATLWSAGDGPARLDHGAPAGYSQSPRGAALAVWNAWMTLQRNDDGAKQVIEHQMAVSDAERHNLLDAAGDGPLPVDSPERSQIAPAGYKLTSCAPDYMVIDIARPVFVDEDGTKLEEPQFYALRFGAVWADGDWQLQTEPMKNSPGAVPNLDGWVRWAL